MNLKNLVSKNMESGNLQNILEASETKKLKSLKEEEEAIIDGVICDIWRNYNDDDNDILDKEEMEKFVFITLIEHGNRKYQDIDQLRNDYGFQKCFEEFDGDDSGTISKDELKDFVN